MNALNPALTIAGPAVIVWQDKAIYSKGDIPVAIKEEYLDLESSAYGIVGKSVKNTLLETSLTPLGTLDSLEALFPAHLRAAIPGVLVHKAQDIGSIATATGIVTKAAHGWREGAMVRLATFGTMPAGWSASTLYYLHALTTGTYTLHLTAAAAAAGTDPVKPTDTGTGRHRIIQQETLTIWSLTEGRGYVFVNAAVTKMPDLTGSAQATALGEVTFTLYRKFGADPATDANAFYTEITEAPSVDLTFDPDAIAIGAFTLGWGATAPWSSMSLGETGAKVAFTLGTSPVGDQVAGIVSHRVDKVDATLTARPKNVTESDVFAKRVLQGTGAGVGRRLAGEALTLTGTEWSVALNNAVLDDSPVGFDGKEDRVRDLKWTATRKFSGGAIQDLFTITVAA